jgi:hypothetical protein
LLIRDYHREDVPQIWNITRLAFTGFPWFEKMTKAQIRLRWNDFLSHSGSVCLVTKVEGSVKGAHWFHEINDHELGIVKDKRLVSFAEGHGSIHVFGLMPL